MCNVKSNKAEEFIDDPEILEGNNCICYKNKDNQLIFSLSDVLRL